MISGKESIKKDEELFINYGHENNIDLVSLYGFTLANTQSNLKFKSDELIKSK